MTDTKSELTTLFDKLVEESTFSVQGVKAIEALRTKAEVQAKDLAYKDKRIAELTDDLRRELERGEKARLEIEAFKARIGELEGREKKVTESEKKEAVAVAVAEAYKDCLHTVFKPNTVRSEMMRQLPYTSTPSQYGTAHSGYMSQPESETRTEG